MIHSLGGLIGRQDSNVILSNAFEYRQPSERARTMALENAARGKGDSRADMTSRFLGLIVVPGDQIAKLEVEERNLPQPTQPGVGQMPVRLKQESSG